MSRNNGQNYRNFMAFRQKNLERQNGRPEEGGSHGSGVEEMIQRHKIFAMVNGDELLKYARECYVISGRGAVTVLDDVIANYDPYASTPFAAQLMYVNSATIEMLPPTMASKAVAMVEIYDVEKRFVFLVVSTKGASVYAIGMPNGASDDKPIDS